jgi:hypothetical protein
LYDATSTTFLRSTRAASEWQEVREDGEVPGSAESHKGLMKLLFDDDLLRLIVVSYAIKWNGIDGCCLRWLPFVYFSSNGCG